MSTQLKITFENKYVQVHSDGEKSYQFALQLWTEVAQTCSQYNCFKVLGIAKTTIPVTTLEAYDHYKIFKQAGITRQHRIAWVELNPEAYKTSYFVETVLRNRGMSYVRLFSDIEEAKLWLSGEQNKFDSYP